MLADVKSATGGSIRRALICAAPPLLHWRHFPLFILNKVISLAAVGFVACSYLVGKIILLA